MLKNPEDDISLKQTFWSTSGIKETEGLNRPYSGLKASLEWGQTGYVFPSLDSPFEKQKCCLSLHHWSLKPETEER